MAVGNATKLLMGNLENAVTVASWFDPAAFQPAGHGQLASAFAEAAVVVVDRQGVDDAAESDVDDDHAGTWLGRPSW